MPLAYLIDENLRGALAIALMRRATRYGLRLDLTQVGDAAAPPLGTLDPELLIWAEANERILVSRDRGTMGEHLAIHLADGRHSPGVFILRNDSLDSILEFLILAAFASDATDWVDQLTYIPV
jgi:hypothetical protein